MGAAVLQNAIGVGGRSKVLATVINLLTDHDYTVDIHTLSSDSDTQRFFDYYNLDQCNVQTVAHRGSRVPGTIYQQPALNLAARSDLPKYDLVFNSNNCVRFLPSGPEYIHYIHFPTSQNPMIDPKYRQMRYFLASVPLRILSTLTVANPQGAVYTNSKFTLKHTQKAYDLVEAKVLYPPALKSVKFTGFSGEGVVSVGAFNSNKRQLLQLEMARLFPETKFRIVGSMDSESYYESCKEYVSNHSLENVSLLTDVSDSRLNQLLNQSRVFLHTMKNERFGIATVEALNHGCVPVVHNSGGQQEVVPNPEFRFDTLDECKNILEISLSGQSPSKNETRKSLEQFTEERFRNILSKAF
jgi:glycosyltransferase involved in cell wall biosynthesis